MHNKIGTFEIENDIKITQEEIARYEAEKDILMKNPRENKLEIYLKEGGIVQRKRFIQKLKTILEDRKKEE